MIPIIRQEKPRGSLFGRRYTQFDGLAWYNYVEAFRRDAAARHAVDWSGMHVELYNFHTLPLLA